ncbi:MAG: dimethylsulfoniopropionate demethylase [Pseudomonadota bacterium]
MAASLQMTRRIRRTPYTRRVEQAGVKDFTVVNHMLLPKSFQHTPEEDYWHLRNHVQLWDVSTQRQVQLEGPDAIRLAQWMTPRDLRPLKTGQCMYAPLVDENGGMVNDPVILRLADEKLWMSIADSDVLLWGKGLAAGSNFDVKVTEPDVSPLAVQGPQAGAVLSKVFGPSVTEIGFFRFKWFEFEGTNQLVARSGYSKQGGFEIYLNGSHLGERLWDAIWNAGEPYKIRAGCPNLAERIEAGLLSYGNEFTLENNPLECGLAQYCSLDNDIDSLAADALRTITEEGVERLMRGVLFDPPSDTHIAQPWPVLAGERQVGQVTSGTRSPRLERHVGLSMIDRGFWRAGQKVRVLDPNGCMHHGEISELPFK